MPANSLWAPCSHVWLEETAGSVAGIVGFALDYFLPSCRPRELKRDAMRPVPDFRLGKEQGESTERKLEEKEG